MESPDNRVFLDQEEMPDYQDCQDSKASDHYRLNQNELTVSLTVLQVIEVCQDRRVRSKDVMDLQDHKVGINSCNEEH